MSSGRRALLVIGAGLIAQGFGVAALSADTQTDSSTVHSARAQAPFDPVGYWVSLVTQNWRFRMIVPGRGEYADVPLNEKAKALADSYDAGQDEAAGKQCEAYGAPVIMRQPTRLHISWASDNDLRVDTDNGEQTRVLHFGPPVATAAPEASWQGYSVARWIMHATSPLGAPPAPGAPTYGSIQINTDHLLPGLLRKNGVPYSGETKVLEYWEVHTEQATGDTWMTVTTDVQDPTYLRGSYSYNSVFEKELDGSKWDPEPCSLRF